MGFLLLTTASSIFLYYTVWVLVLVSYFLVNPFVGDVFSQPFVDFNHPFQQYFPDRIYAIAIPCALFVLALVVVGMFISVILIRDSYRRKKNS